MLKFEEWVVHWFEVQRDGAMKFRFCPGVDAALGNCLTPDALIVGRSDSDFALIVGRRHQLSDPGVPWLCSNLPPRKIPAGGVKDAMVYTGYDVHAGAVYSQRLWSCVIVDLIVVVLAFCSRVCAWMVARAPW